MQSSAIEQFEQGVLQTIRRRGLLAGGDRVVVGVSGGPDSLALLHALHSLREELGFSLHVAHLNHRMRRAAPEDARFVAHAAADLGIPCTVEAVDVRAAQRRSGSSLEHAARRERYRFFARVAAQTGANRVATAHTADDNVETVLINILRGAGTDGLGGIPPSRPLQTGTPSGPLAPSPPHPLTPSPPKPVFVVRPLIDTWRADVEAYCRSKGLEPREDVTNRSRAFLRNRVRLDLLPYLGRRFGPEVKANLNRLAEIARPEIELLEHLAGEAADRVSHRSDGGILLSVPGVTALPIALQRRVVRGLLREVKGSPEEIGFREIERVLEAVASPGAAAFDLPGPVHVRREGDSLILARPAAQAPAPTPGVPLPVPGQAVFGMGVVHAVILPRPEGFEPPRVPRAREVYLDADAVEGSLSVRARLPGERFVPLGMAGSKSLQDLLTDMKVPAAERANVPLVVDHHGILWVAGLAIADRARVRPGTRRLLRLQWCDREGVNG